jgi:hypothetical protein
MADSIPILWPEDISVDVVAPIAILRAQIEPLKQRTNGLLTVRIATQTSDQPSVSSASLLPVGPGAKWVTHEMELVAHLLDNFRFQVVTVSHRSDQVYPVSVQAKCFESKINWPEAQSPEEFIDLLGQVLRSRETRAAINSIIARINEQNASLTPSSAP